MWNWFASLIVTFDTPVSHMLAAHMLCIQFCFSSHAMFPWNFTAFQREWHICVCQQSSFSVSLQTRWRKLSHNVFCISSGILYDCRKRFFSKLNPQSKFCSDIFVPYMGGSPQLWPKFEVVLWNTLGAQWVRWICHSCALARWRIHEIRFGSYKIP